MSRMIDGDRLMMSLADWWYSSFGKEETEEAKAIRKVMDKVEKSLDKFIVPRWIPCSERLPEEDFCSGRGVQYSETVLVTVVNNGDYDDTFVDMACTADGVWQLNYPQDTSPLIPKWCKVIAWMPLPTPYEGR